jgi:orotate phosphoribosyltransferase
MKTHERSGEKESRGARETSPDDASCCCSAAGDGRAAELEDFRKRLHAKLASAVRTGKITLSSGKVTDFYFDGRLVSIEPEGSVLIAELMLEEIVTRGVAAVGGLTSGADPITSAVGVLAWQRRIPLRLFYVRKAAKDHGTQKRIEGPPLVRDLPVAIVDDVITTGGSLLQTRDALRDEVGARVTDALVVIDREEGGREVLEKEGIRVTSLFRKRDFLP